ncbi:MAG: hypothetical protein NC041_00400 [Bacteroides sp.]|nr:hypothetical protein [Prevotella sp.]MCM1408597.1 hypothetical protein [Treponema brennaborense]MCM1468915.1 hypothetical protein [Bacteroides sp.]
MKPIYSRPLCFSACACAVVLFFSCASASFPVLENFQPDDCAALVARIDNEKSSLYGTHDQVLYSLDTGILAYYAGNYALSTERFAAAERLMFDYYAKSVTQEIGSFLLNDTIIDYAGEDYEDIYSNLFMALNYLNLDDIDSAFVEIRRFDNKQKALGSKYAAQIEAAKKSAPPTDTDMQEVQFHNSALARYLSMLMYRAAGDLDAAAVDARYIDSAFAAQKKLYPFAKPLSVAEELNLPRNKARLNIIGFSGLAPEKIEYVLRCRIGDIYGKIALPSMKRRASAVHAIQVAVADESGNEKKFFLEKIESIENIAVDTFNSRRALIYFKTIARAAAKTSASSVFSSIASDAEDANEAFLFSLLTLTSVFSHELTEKADIRTSRYFPAEASVGGITLEPGIYNVSVVFLGKNNHTLYTKECNAVNVQSGALNLLEAVCLY